MDFSPLPLKDGVGPTHVNQFRIAFRLRPPVANASSALPALVKDFYNQFPKYFNGSSSGIFAPPRSSKDALKLTPRTNVATVKKGDRSYLGKDTLRFVVDQNMEWFTPPGGFGIPMPDFHSDWVGVIEERPGIGFAVQTLRRHFSEIGDLEAQAIEIAARTADPTGIVGSLIFDFNSFHFLAGRRSWRIGLVNENLPGWRLNKETRDARTGSETTFVTDPVLYLETAAIERSSKGLYALLEYDPGLVMDLRDYLVTIWVTLLNNYVGYRAYDRDSRPPTHWQSDDGDKLWEKDTKTWVWHRTGSFDTLSLATKTDWVQSVIKLHPALAQ